MDGEGLFRYSGGGWEKVDFPELSQYIRFYSSSQTLYIITSANIFRLSASGELVTIGQDILQSPSDIVTAENGKLWVADKQLGLLPDLEGTTSGYYPAGPDSDHLAHLQYAAGKIVAIENTLNEDGEALNKPAAFSVFDAGSWQNYSGKNTAALSGLYNFTGIAYHNGTNTFYFSSFGHGAIAWQPEDNTFFPLQKSMPEVPFLTDKLTTVASDLSGNVWFAEQGFPSTLYFYSPEENKWNSYALGTNDFIFQILPFSFGDIWLRALRVFLLRVPRIMPLRD